MQRIPCTLLGATGAVGQRFAQLLEGHPRFELVKVCASPGSAGVPYAQRVAEAGGLVPDCFGALELEVADPSGEVTPLVFSALDTPVARELEEPFAKAGALVVSNASAHRMDPLVPLVVPEVNAGHLELLAVQRRERGYPGVGGVVTNPNCSTIGFSLALAPLMEFGARRAHVVTLQALSGAGLSGPAGMQMIDNLLPFIPNEEDKLTTESRKIFGEFDGTGVKDAELTISAQCNRVAVIDGHTGCVSIELEREGVGREELVAGWREWRGVPQELGLHSAPEQPVVYLDAVDAPQPRLHRGLEKGMATSVGRLQECPVLGWRFVFLSHNTLRGAAGGALLVAEVADARGWVE